MQNSMSELVGKEQGNEACESTVDFKSTTIKP